VLVANLYWTLLFDKGALKTIASPLHQAIVLADSIAYQSIGFLCYHPNPINYPSMWLVHTSQYFVANFSSAAINLQLWMTLKSAK